MHMRGGDPVQRRHDAKTARTLSAANRFEDVADEYISKCEAEDYAEATTKKARWFLDLLRPALGKRPIAEIKPHALLAALKKIEARGCRESATPASGPGSRPAATAPSTSAASRRARSARVRVKALSDAFAASSPARQRSTMFAAEISPDLTVLAMASAPFIAPADRTCQAGRSRAHPARPDWH